MADFSFLLTNIYNELVDFEKELKKSSTNQDNSRVRFNAACDIVLKFETFFNHKSSETPNDFS